MAKDPLSDILIRRIVDYGEVEIQRLRDLIGLEAEIIPKRCGGGSDWIERLIKGADEWRKENENV